MLQVNEIRQRFERIEQAIDQASQSAEHDMNASPELKDCIDKLERESGKAKQVMQSSDEEKIRDCVDDLENLGDDAKRACSNDLQATPQLRQAVIQVHEQLSKLKHQLH